MKVKITRGYYGYHNGKASELKDINSPAFEVNEEEAERIIGLGIAKAVSVTNSNAPDGDMITGRLTEEQLRTLPYSKLKQLCKELGVSAVGKQEELIARIVAMEVQAPKQDEEDIDDFDSNDTGMGEDDSEGECPPMLAPAEPEE